jgi:outer membrane receptor protein involved in Fe transport
MINDIDYRKGTYFPDTGDFSMAGSARMYTVENLEPFAAAEAGEYGWRRAVAGGSMPIGDGRLTVAGQWKTYDGPWQQPEQLQHESAWGKFTLPVSPGELQLSAWGYHATWRPTEQIPERVIGSPLCADEFCALDPSAAGRTLRWIGTARLLAQNWTGSMYFQYYDWNMLSNPTYDFQINQFDRRYTLGGRYAYEYQAHPNLKVSGGVEQRYDDIEAVGIEHTHAGRFMSPISSHAVQEASFAGYARAEWSPLEVLRINAGLRGDWYLFDVDALRIGLSDGNKTAAQVSPKLGIAWMLNDEIELYANWGKGFHSNDARGVVDNVTPVAGLSTGRGFEGGVRFEHGDIRLTATYWWLGLDSELKFVGDSNSVEPGAATDRHGYEIVGFWQPREWLSIDAVWTGSTSRYRDSPGAEFVSGAIEHAGDLGLTANLDHWEAGLRVRHLGAYPLLEDNSMRAAAETTLNLRLAWKGAHLMLYGELLNIIDSAGKDISYYYASNVSGFDPPGLEVDGRVSRAVEPRTLRGGIKYVF